MSLTRSALLWASQNRRLAKQVPRLPFVRRALRKFMPGETADAAIDAAQRLATGNISTTLTNLGENLTELTQADAVTDHYLEVQDRIHALGLDAEVSIKLTHLGLDLDVGRAAENLHRLTARAQQLGSWVWVDMESSSYVDATLDVYRRTRQQYSNVGVCLQAYLHRTPQDMAELLSHRPGIRLVKGAYREPGDVALQKKRDIDERFHEIAVELLRPLAAGSARVALATHDVDLLDRIAADAQTAGLDMDAYEIQMLYGIRTADQLRLADAGYRVRTLISYGEAWYPWYMRRLAERPSNLWFVARNVFSRRL